MNDEIYVRRAPIPPGGTAENGHKIIHVSATYSP